MPLYGFGRDNHLGKGERMDKRFIVLGAGKMGRVAARALLETPGQRVTLTDVQEEVLEAAKQEIGAVIGSQALERLETRRLDASDEIELVHALMGHDVVLNALYFTFNETVARAAIKAGVHYTDLGGHVMGVTARVLALSETAKEKGVTLIPDLGVAPGMINVLAGYGARHMETVERIHMYVGGIPLRPKPPFGYAHVFSLEGLFDHYEDEAEIIREGRRVRVPALSEIETVYFPYFGPLEAFHTAGGTSTLIDTFRDAGHLMYKTVRYPGHAAQMGLLKTLGFFDREKKVEIDTVKMVVRPRDVLLAILKKTLDLGEDDDVVLLRVLVQGLVQGQKLERCYETITFRHPHTQVTAMAQTTAYSLVVVAEMLARGEIEAYGALPPETSVPGKTYMERMEARGVAIQTKERLID